MLATLIKNFVHFTFGKVDIPNKRNFRKLVGHHVITRHYGASRRCVVKFKFVCCFEFERCIVLQLKNSAKYDATFRTLFASNLDLVRQTMYDCISLNAAESGPY